jgi:hypothetical protein
MVQLNPPGASAPPVDAAVPALPASRWSAQPVPTAAPGESTADPPTPRQVGT